MTRRFKIPAADGPKGLSDEDRLRCQGLHPDLIAVIERAFEIGPPMKVVEGLRDLATQRRYLKLRRSKTLNSRHLTGHAVDLCSTNKRQDGFAEEDLAPIVKAMKQAAKELGVPMTHGADWGWDSPHHELSWKAYPAKSGVTIGDRVARATSIAASARAVGGAALGTAGTVAATNPETVTEAVSVIPAVPDQITDAVANGSAWQAITDEAWRLGQWALSLPLYLQLPLGLSLVLVAFWPQVSAFLTPSSQESEQSG